MDEIDYPSPRNGGWENDGAVEEFEKLIEDIPEFMGEEDRQDEEFRLNVLMNQVGDIARHTTHCPERNPSTRPLEEDPEVAYGDALWQLLCVGWSQGINVTEALEHALARMDTREGYKQQSDEELSGMVAHSDGEVSGIIGHDVMAVHEFSPDMTLNIGDFELVLTEVGGISSHAATVAREQDVPCVVGIQGLTDNVQMGDEVTVDTQSGDVQIY